MNIIKIGTLYFDLDAPSHVKRAIKELQGLEKTLKKNLENEKRKEEVSIKKFIERLKTNSQIVSTWPAWKQKILGNINNHPYPSGSPEDYNKEYK